MKTLFLKVLREQYVMQDKGTILFVTHDYRDLYYLADKWAILQNGTLIRDGTRQSLQKPIDLSGFDDKI